MTVTVTERNYAEGVLGRVVPAFSTRSRERLSSCDPRLIELFERVVQGWDCTILEGHRGEEAQNEAERTGRSTLRWPEGKHNRRPSRAVDAAPYPIDWSDMDRWRAFGGFVLGVAEMMDIPIRWGGDWDGDRTFRDQNFNDLSHFELSEARSIR